MWTDRTSTSKAKRLEDSVQMVALLDSPPAPISGWETVTEVNAHFMAKKIPRVTTGTVYTYLSAHVSQGSGDGCSGLFHVDTLTGHQDALTV